MKLLDSAEKIRRRVLMLMEKYEEYHWAVAWATSGDHLDKLIENKQRIARITFGTHFYQTHPDVLKAFVGSEKVRFNLDTSSLFHPKVYLFRNSDNEWACIVGSPNFTRAALKQNKEVAVMFDQEDEGANDIRRHLLKTIRSYWNDAKQVDGRRYISYSRLYDNAKNKIRRLEDSVIKQGNRAVDCEIRQMSWEEYYDAIIKEAKRRKDSRDRFRKRLEVLDRVQKLFGQHSHFSDLRDMDRKRIAGTLGKPEADGIDWGWFGSMTGAGKFMNRINDNNPKISIALDAIPATGFVHRQNFIKAKSAFLQAFPKKGGGIEGGGIGGLTRLLAMKRPDTFLCMNRPVIPVISKKMGIPQSHLKDPKGYWDELLERLMDTPWWKSPPPQGGDELRAWCGRMAMVDAIFYPE